MDVDYNLLTISWTRSENDGQVRNLKFHLDSVGGVSIAGAYPIDDRSNALTKQSGKCEQARVGYEDNKCGRRDV